MTRILPIVVGLVAAAVSSAHGQGTIDGPYFNNDLLPCMNCVMPTPPHASTGDPELDRAMAICDRHSHDTGTVYLTVPPSRDVQFDQEWFKDCVAVEAAWAKSVAAHQQAEKAAKDAADKKFVDDYAAALRAAGKAP